MFRRIAYAICFFLVCVAGAAAPSSAQQNLIAAGKNADNAERAYKAAVKEGEPALRAFLTGFPKGADLHVHLSGAVYAETFIREAGVDGLCVDPVALRFAQPPCTGQLVPAALLSGNIDRQRQLLYNRLTDSISMQGFVPSAGWSGHDQFFSVFDKIGVLKEHSAEWVDEAASRAAAQNNQYLELMQVTPFSRAAELAQQIGWNVQLTQGDEKAFAQYRNQLLDKGLGDEVKADRDWAQKAEAGRKQIEGCGTGQAAPACQVESRYLFTVLRDLAPEVVFAQLLLGFETVEASMAAKDDTWVGINLVRPEDDFVSMRDYTLQMKMIGYLHSVYPNVPISLHAGELTLGLVPPEGLRFHIRQAVEFAGAQRIGHGVDVMYEDDAQGLLNDLKLKHVMVEINLSSNEGILGIKGSAHPFTLYWASGVPVALSTDDEGVSRIDLTNEYVRAALDYKLSYSDLKKLARTGVEHSFLPGQDLWAWPDDLEAVKQPCVGETLGGDTPSASCKAFLGASEKATAEWELERRFRAFQAKF